MEKPRERGVNHTMYELYLQEDGFQDTCEKTKDYNLGDIKTYVEVYDDIDTGESFELLNLILWLNDEPSVESIDDADYQFLRKLRSIRSLESILEEQEVRAIKAAMDRINSYHIKRKAKEDGREDYQ